MKIKKVLAGVLSIGIAATLAACSGETEDQDEIMENPPETEMRFLPAQLHYAQHPEPISPT